MYNILESYVNLIHYEPLRQDTWNLLNLNEVKQAFEYPSSISGKYHPQDEFAKYGLLLHSLRVCNLAVQLYRCSEDYSYNRVAYDTLIASALLHDVPYKYIGNYTNKTHAHDNSIWYSQNSKMENYIEALSEIPMVKKYKENIEICIMYHMGRWDLQEHSDYKQFPLNLLAWTLHQSDVIVSRSNILVNINSVEYLKSNMI